MMNKKPSILIISSCPLSGGGIIAAQYYEALKIKGINADLLLKLPEPERSDILYVWDKDYSKTLFYRIKRKIRRILNRWKEPKGFYFFYRKDNEPPVPTKDILRKINKNYDLVYVVFWQTMLSFESIDKIYDKLHCQFQFAAVDYSQMSGGCHFTGDCQRYMIGCGCCPAFDSNDENDFTAWNVQYRKRVYEKVKPIVYGNHYMLDFYKRSYLLKNVRCELSPIVIIDTDVFKPIEKRFLRKKLGIPDNKTNIIFFACEVLNDERKGMKYLIESFQILKERVKIDREHVLVVMAGKGFNKIRPLIPFDTKDFGFVPMNSLPELFSVSTLFVCPSVNDAGPMMVAQSLCCGVPVVGFDMGAVKQLVKGQGTGICVPLKDTEALADGIETIITMSEVEYSKISEKSREVGLKYCSFESQANLILNTYYKYKNM